MTLPMPLEAWAARAPRTRWPFVLLIGLAGGITGCGGGDADDDDRAGIGPVDCKAHPEQCQ